MPPFHSSRLAAWLLAASMAPCAVAQQPSWDLLFTSTRDGNGEIFLLEAGSKDWINLTNHPSTDNWAEWSPDGKTIVFQSNRSGNLDLWRMDADGKNLIQLTDDPEADYLPAWSPDGTEIYFSSWRRQGEEARANHTYKMRSDGSAETRVLADSPGISAGVAISPDGGSLVVSRDASGMAPTCCLSVSMARSRSN
jgi:Tol biopolymer transport system component